MWCILFWILLLFHTTKCCVYKYADISSHPKFEMLPNDECGESEHDRIIGGVSASMGQLPFMSRIGYTIENCEDELEFKCGGALITKDHVITAAHCVDSFPDSLCARTKNFEKYIVKIVRLGEHFINQDPDCERDVCAEPVQDIDVEMVTVHPYYNRPRLRNDIAVIKLKTSAVFNGWVAPICLIYGDLANKNYTGMRGIVAGWGIVDTRKREPSNELQVLKVPIVSYETCFLAFEKIAKISHLQQICAGGVYGEDSCSGDSGGPLIVIDDTAEGPRYKALGIVSFGFRLCAFRPVPAVYTNMLFYGEWILDSL